MVTQMDEVFQATMARINTKVTTAQHLSHRDCSRPIKPIRLKVNLSEPVLEVLLIHSDCCDDVPIWLKVE